MPDEHLEKFIPKYGDRAAIRNFCKQSTNSLRQSLVQKLQSKIGSKTLKNEKIKRNDKHIKKTRIIEIGWLCSYPKEKRLRQVRTISGGGTRRMAVDKNSKCLSLLEKAKDLFFPNGISTKGRLGNFDIELLDYKSHAFDLNMTIQQMYEISALSTLRFYLATTSKDGGNSTATDTDFIPATITNSDSFISDRNLRSTERNQNQPSSLALYIGSLTEESLTGSTKVDEPIANDLFNYDFEILQDDPIISLTKEVKTIRIHRGQIFNEFIEVADILYNNTTDLKIEMVLPNGETEHGEDFGGVFRDALSEFWESFYNDCTIGTNFKVPCLRHDMGCNEWKAIAKIFVTGYQLENYIPIKIAPVFLESCLGIVPDDKTLSNNFITYVCDFDSDTIKKALNDFHSVDSDDLLNIFSSYDSKWVPNENNIKQLVRDIAHKELIQKPSFALDCFKEVFSKTHLDSEKIKQQYCNLSPTVKNCLSRIKMSDLESITQEKLNVFGYLKQYLKESDEKTRMLFFRFATGSNLPIREITVSFMVSTSTLTRCPVAHTCTGMLELPETYESFVIFRSEFNSLLNSNIWVMDII